MWHASATLKNPFLGLLLCELSLRFVRNDITITIVEFVLYYVVGAVDEQILLVVDRIL